MIPTIACGITSTCYARSKSASKRPPTSPAACRVLAGKLISHGACRHHLSRLEGPGGRRRGSALAGGGADHFRHVAEPAVARGGAGAAPEHSADGSAARDALGAR